MLCICRLRHILQRYVSGAGQRYLQSYSIRYKAVIVPCAGGVSAFPYGQPYSGMVCFRYRRGGVNGGNDAVFKEDFQEKTGVLSSEFF